MSKKAKQDVVLEESHVYRLHYTLQNGNGQWIRYEAVMTYLGANRFPQYEGQPKGMRELSFNLRPIAGTQTLRVDQILGAEDLGPSKGRDDSRHKAKRRLGAL